MEKFKRVGLIVFILIMTVGCDQFSKKMAESNLSSSGNISYLGDTFRFQYIKNNGAFLSMGSAWPNMVKFSLLNVMPLVILTGLFVYLLKSEKIENFSFIAMSLILGGGISNLWDRLFNDGWVVDFMNIGIGNIRTGIFNFADVFILSGFALLFLSLLKNKHKQQD